MNSLNVITVTHSAANELCSLANEICDVTQLNKLGQIGKEARDILKQTLLSGKIEMDWSPDIVA